MRDAGDQDEADALTAAALREAERAGDQRRVLHALNQMASSTLARRDHEAARQQFLDVKEKHTNGMIFAQGNCGWACLGLEDHLGAAAWLRESLRVAAT